MSAFPNARAPVWPYYVAYCVAMALMYAGVMAMGGVLLSVGNKADDQVMGAILAIVGFPLLLLYAAAPFLPKRPWAWVFHLVLIGIAMTSACCIPVGIPLLILWLKPETKAMFGRD